MKNFPDLRNNQVAIMRAEASTGHVLDDEFKIVINDEQDVYTVFDSVDLALAFSKKIISERNNIEIVIYACDKQVLHYLN